MATFRESETETIALIEWHRSCGRTVTRRTEQAMTEADACAAAHALKPGVPTRAFLAGGVLLASHEFSARCKALSRKADSDA